MNIFLSMFNIHMTYDIGLGHQTKRFYQFTKYKLITVIAALKLNLINYLTHTFQRPLPHNAMTLEVLLEIESNSKTFGVKFVQQHAEIGNNITSS